jgi:hypothetical protein
MKKRIAFVALLGIIILSSAGLRGCGDFMRPVPWAPDARTGVSAAAPAA